MKVFNIGILEALLILILALVILGPQRAIKAAREAGLWVRKIMQSPLWKELVATSNEIRDFPKKVMDDVELQKLTEDLDFISHEIASELEEIPNRVDFDSANLDDASESTQSEDSSTSD